MISTITTKGQVTISIAIRRQFGIKPNDQVDFITEGDRIILVPVKTLRDFRGVVAGEGDSDLELQTAKDAVGRRVVEEMS
jgi:AbrB family looped-hinge helix DNA binding protein